MPSFVQSLLPRSDRFFDLLEEQARLAHAAATVLAEAPSGLLANEMTRERIQDLEHEGDAYVHEMATRLAKSFVTPVDREDLQRLSFELDAVLDMINLVARCAVLFGLPRATPPMLGLAAKLVEGTACLAVAVGRVRRHEFEGLLTDAREITKLETEADGIFRDAVSSMFADARADVKAIIRDKEILGYLERALNACEDVGESLRHLAVKHT